MNSSDLIEYILQDLRKSMIANDPKEFMSEAQGIHFFSDIIQGRLVHIKEALFQAWMVGRKTEGART